MSRSLFASVALVVATLSSGCVLVTEPVPQPEYIDEGPITAPIDARPSAYVMDSGRSLRVAGGEGIGAYLEARGDGTYRLSWTCDSNITGYACPARVSVRSESGFIAGASFSVSQLDDAFVGQNSFWADSTTSYGVDAVEFRAPYGGVIFVAFEVAGAVDESYVYFVDGGRVAEVLSGGREVPFVESGF